MREVCVREVREVSLNEDAWFRFTVAVVVRVGVESCSSFDFSAINTYKDHLEAIHKLMLRICAVQSKARVHTGKNPLHMQ